MKRSIARLTLIAFLASIALALGCGRGNDDALKAADGKGVIVNKNKVKGGED